MKHSTQAGSFGEMQIRCLAIDWRRMKLVDDQVGALRGIALAEAAMSGDADRIEALLDMLMPKLETLVLDDGGHASRMPDRQVMLMRRLVETRIATSLVGADGTRLSETIDRMGGILGCGATVTVGSPISTAAAVSQPRLSSRRCFAPAREARPSSRRPTAVSCDWEADAPS